MKMLLIAIAALSLCLMVGQPALAEKVHEGVAVRAGNERLTMTDKEGKNEHTHNVAPNATIMLDGRQSRLDAIRAGFWVKVTTDDNREVTKIEARTQR